MKISRHLLYEQSIKSQTAERKGIENIPDTEQLENMKYVAKNIYDKVADQFPGTYLNSFFRGDALNKAIGGSKTSQHRTGEAVDIDHATKNKQIFDYIRKNLEFDQLIWEFGDEESPAWVHASLRRDSKNRKQILVAYSENGKTKYKPWVSK